MMIRGCMPNNMSSKGPSLQAAAVQRRMGRDSFLPEWMCELATLQVLQSVCASAAAR